MLKIEYREQPTQPIYGILESSIIAIYLASDVIRCPTLHLLVSCCALRNPSFGARSVVTRLVRIHLGNHDIKIRARVKQDAMSAIIYHHGHAAEGNARTHRAWDPIGHYSYQTCQLLPSGYEAKTCGLKAPSQNAV